jgi:hypothetical protein
MPTRAELEEFLTPIFLEMTYACSVNAAKRGDRNLGMQGLRAARAKDPKVMRVLEALAEATDKRDEELRGRTKRDTGTAWSRKHSAQEVAFCREAYNAADEGRADMDRLQFIYGAAAAAAGVIKRPPYWGVPLTPRRM